MVTIPPYAGINKYMEKSNNFLNNGTYGKTMVPGNTSNVEALIDKVNIKSLEHYENLKISLDSILNL